MPKPLDRRTEQSLRELMRRLGVNHKPVETELLAAGEDAIRRVAAWYEAKRQREPSVTVGLFIRAVRAAIQGDDWTVSKTPDPRHPQARSLYHRGRAEPATTGPAIDTSEPDDPFDAWWHGLPALEQLDVDGYVGLRLEARGITDPPDSIMGRVHYESGRRAFYREMLEEQGQRP